MAPLQPVCPSTEFGWKDLVLGRAHAHEEEGDLLYLEVLMKWDKVSGKNIIHKNHPCLSQYRPYKVNPMHTPGRADPCSDTRRALRLYFPSRVLPQQVPPWSQASIISTPHSTSQHLPASLKSSQTPTLQMFLHYQEFLSILTLQAPTS